MVANIGAIDPGLGAESGRLRAIWAPRDMILGLVVVVGGSLLIVLLVGAALFATGGVGGPAERIAGAIAAVALESLLGLWVVARVTARRLSWAELGFVPPRRWAPLWIAWGGSYAILIGYTVALKALELVGIDASRFTRGNALPLDASDGGAVLLILGVAVVALAPLCEELFFRALLFRGLRGYWRLGPALLVSGLLFGLFHLNVSVVLPFTLIGVLFAWSTEASGSIYTSIAAHGAVNGLSFVLTVALLNSGLDIAALGLSVMGSGL